MQAQYLVASFGCSLSVFRFGCSPTVGVLGEFDSLTFLIGYQSAILIEFYLGFVRLGRFERGKSLCTLFAALVAPLNLVGRSTLACFLVDAH